MEKLLVFFFQARGLLLTNDAARQTWPVQRREPTVWGSKAVGNKFRLVFLDVNDNRRGVVVISLGVFSSLVSMCKTKPNSSCKILDVGAKTFGG